MRQFLDIKERYPDAIVFFRLGDFYEMFFEDAVVAARLLSLTLTTRDKGKADAVPMCGVPHHAARNYVTKLTAAGHKVVIAEQTEDAKQAKGLVKRDVVRVVTPGVILDDDALEPRTAHYLVAVGALGDAFGVAYLDVTTGEFRATQVPDVAAATDELARIGGREILVAAADVAPRLPLALARRRSTVPWTVVAAVDAQGATARLASIPLPADMPEAARRAAAMVLGYAQATQPVGVVPVRELAVYQPGDAVLLDESAITNLELVETIIGRHRRGSLLDVLDDTRTSPGARCLRRWLLYPLTMVSEIHRRQRAVTALVDGGGVRAELRAVLDGVADLERLAGKTTLAVAVPRDLGRLRDSLLTLPALAALLGRLDGGAELLDGAGLATPALAALAARLAAALVDAPPGLLKDGGVIRAGHDATIDECRGLADGGKDALAAIEVRERAASGIPGLKVRYNRVFGYYLEVTRSQVGRVPAHFVRKQTVAGGERYVTPELAELEQRVLSAEARLAEREATLHAGLVADVAAIAHQVAAVGRRLAIIDACQSLAEVATRRGYVRPEVDGSTRLDIVGGRHPVVEALLPTGEFVANDCVLGGDPAAPTLLLVTGPNMAGKSTYMRQVAQIVLMAQVGGYVPATRAHVGVCDRVFARVGAADNLARGDSTFMVEMRETAAILAGATARSLVVFDEVGRGTSTFDGVSIAWAIAEHLHDSIGARALFATHYHELVALAERKPRIHNVSAAVAEQGGTIVFLRRIVDGAASRSYGIDVARLAGLPREVIARARQVLAKLEASAAHGGTTSSAQLSLLPAASTASPPVIDDALRDRLRAIDIDQLTPLAALGVLAELCAGARRS